MGAGICFGEIALLYNDKRTSTIKALDDCSTWVLEGQIFRSIIIKTTVLRRNTKLGFLDKVPILCIFICSIIYL